NSLVVVVLRNVTRRPLASPSTRVSASAGVNEYLLERRKKNNDCLAGFNGLLDFASPVSARLLELERFAIAEAGFALKVITIVEPANHWLEERNIPIK